MMSKAADILGRCGCSFISMGILARVHYGLGNLATRMAT